ncbi:MAG: pyridoxal-dependent decarboxylase [Acidobacteriota bacterium]
MKDTVNQAQGSHENSGEAEKSRNEAMRDDSSGLGDLDPEEFRKYGHRVVDWIADYLAHPERFPVFPAELRPGTLAAALPESPPVDPQPLDAALDDFENLVLPAVTHWNHPRFFAYFSITGSAPGILGEMLAAALNVNGMLWRTCPAATELENVVVNWVRRLLGLPDDFWGLIYDTASVSTFHALAAARRRAIGPAERARGLAAAPGPLKIYASDQAHSSVDKAVLALGLGLDALRKVPSDAEFRLDPAALEAMVKEDLAQGARPCAVVATVGTTSTTSVDPLVPAADVCRRYGMWLHVDAAYGGAAALLPEMRWILEGAEEADSLVFNPHKWLFTPIDCSVFLTRRREELREAFALVPEYLRSGEEADNLMDYGIQLGRRFRALKLWFVIRAFGAAGLQERIRRHIAWARRLADLIEAHPHFELAAPVPFSTVCFRALPAAPGGTKEIDGPRTDEFNERLLAELNASGRLFLSHTKLRGRYVLRWAVGNLRTTWRDIAESWELVRQTAERLRG